MTKMSDGRIIRSLSGFYEVKTDEGMVTCRARGSLRRGSEIPLTGDLVTISVDGAKVWWRKFVHAATALFGLRLRM